jgi:hypothetical protein
LARNAVVSKRQQTLRPTDREDSCWTSYCIE